VITSNYVIATPSIHKSVVNDAKALGTAIASDYVVTLTGIEGGVQQSVEDADIRASTSDYVVALFSIEATGAQDLYTVSAEIAEFFKSRTRDGVVTIASIYIIVPAKNSPALLGNASDYVISITSINRTFYAENGRRRLVCLLDNASNYVVAITSINSAFVLNSNSRQSEAV